MKHFSPIDMCSNRIINLADAIDAQDVVTLLQFNTAAAAGRYATNVGDGSTTNIVVTHNLGTRDISVETFRVSDNEQVFVDIRHTTINTLTLLFAVAPALNSIRVVVAGTNTAVLTGGGVQIPAGTVILSSPSGPGALYQTTIDAAVTVGRLPTSLGGTGVDLSSGGAAINFLAHGADQSITTGSNNIAIGNGIVLGSATGSNQVNIGGAFKRDGSDNVTIAGTTITQTGGQKILPTTKTATYTVTISDSLLVANHATVPVVFNLPSASGTGMTVKLANAGVATAVADAAGTDLIAGAATQDIIQWATLTLYDWATGIWLLL